MVHRGLGESQSSDSQRILRGFHKLGVWEDDRGKGICLGLRKRELPGELEGEPRELEGTKRTERNQENWENPGKEEKKEGESQRTRRTRRKDINVRKDVPGGGGGHRKNRRKIN